MHVISEVSKLTWEAIEKDFSLEEFRYQLEQIVKKKNKYTSFIINLGAALACGGVGKMFGCDLVAALYTAFAAFIGFFIRKVCVKSKINPYVAIQISSFVATTIAYFTHFLPFSSTPWYPMLACAISTFPVFR